MADQAIPHVIINKPGVVAFGEGLPFPDETDITTFFQHETVVQIACGEDHSAVVCGSGRVYTFGLLGMDVGLEPMGPIGPWLVQSLTSVRINQAACGLHFTVFLTDKGHLYSSGVNQYGQLGLVNRNKIPTGLPSLVTGLPAIKKVAAGFHHTVALTNSGEVWVTGSNHYGQLGLHHKKPYQTTFTRVRNISEPIIDISSIGYHTALISASQLLFICGDNKYSQLGSGKVKIRFSFTKPVSLPSTAAAAVSCGFYHTVALGADGTAWAWGANGTGQSGTGDLDNRSTPTKMAGLEGKVISEVIAGCDQTAVLTRDGEVLMCGYGWDGQLGLRKGSFSTPTLVPKSPGLMVKQVAFSKTFSLLLVVPKSDDNATPQLEIGSTELHRSIMKSLECPVCCKIMSRPIYLCINGHSLCGTCRSDARITACPVCRGHFIVTRNISLENVSDNLKLPLG